MSSHRDTPRSAVTDDKSIEVLVIEEGWVPVVVFKGGGQSSLQKRVENNVAWMLQTLMGSGNKVDSLFDTCDDDYRTLSAVKALGVPNKEINIALIQGRSQRWQNVKAIGVGGKRSHIFGLIVAMGMCGGFNKVFQEELEKYGLAKGMNDLLAKIEILQKAAGASWKSDEQGSWEKEQRPSWKAAKQESKQEYWRATKKESHVMVQSSRPVTPQETSSWSRRVMIQSSRPVTPQEGVHDKHISRHARITKRSSSRENERIRRNVSQDHRLRPPSKDHKTRDASSGSRSPARGNGYLRRHSPEKINGNAKGGSRSKFVGIDLNIVCGTVPVVSLDTSSNFHDKAAWLLQVAMAQDLKASQLMEYIYDRNEHALTTQVHRECRSRLKLRDADIEMVKVLDVPLTEVLAVGSSGKRSAMLAAIIAIALRDEEHLGDCSDFIEEKHPEMVRPFYDLIHHAVELKKRASNSRDDETSYARQDGASNSGAAKRMLETHVSSKRAPFYPPLKRRADHRR